MWRRDFELAKPGREAGVSVAQEVDTNSASTSVNARVLVWRGTTAEMNPSLDPAIIAEAYEIDPLSAPTAYCAEFRDDLVDFVPREVMAHAQYTGA